MDASGSTVCHLLTMPRSSAAVTRGSIPGMRIPGRPAAVLVSVAALAALSGCTVRPPDGDGKQRSPVHVLLPSGTAPAPAGTRAHRPTARPARPAGRVLWSRGDSGTGVRELQARLRQVDWLFD